VLKGKVKEKSDRTCWMEFRDGFEVELRHLPDRLWFQIQDKSKVRGFNRSTHVPEEKTDREKLYRLFADATIVNWRGLTATVLSTMLDMDVYPDEVPYSPEDAFELVYSCREFDNWVMVNAQDLAIFEAERQERERKNSRPSPDEH
jgi:hypothetical protein